MKILREEKEYELSSEELLNAYLEQQYLFDIENIENNMKYRLNDEEYEKLKDNNEFIELAAEKLRRNQDHYDMDYENAFKDAINNTKKKFLNSQKEVEQPKKHYFDIHVSYGSGDSDGYSIFVVLNGNAGEQDALDKAIKDCRFQEPEDIGKIDYIAELEKHEYLECVFKDVVVDSWEDMKRKYPMNRMEMNEYIEKKYVEDCFSLYEKEGFSPIFWSPWNPFGLENEKNGQKIEVVGRCTTENIHLCELPMWKIKFPDGEIINAYPEEVIPSLMRAEGCRLFEKKQSLSNTISSAEKLQGNSEHENKQPVLER